MRRLTSLVLGRLGYGWGVAAGALGLLLACSGEKFNPDSGCADGDCGAASNDGGTSQVGSGGKAGSGGKLASGGKFVGGASNVSGGSAGTDSSGSGGGSTAGSAGMPGTSGTGGNGDPPDFPATDVLDDFNRAGPALGLSWIGGADEYSIKEQALWCEFCTAAALWSTPFGPNQEVFAKLTHFDADAAEINLILKAQSSPDCDLIEVLYAPNVATVRIAYCSEGMWTDLEVTPVNVKPGDRLGARAHESGLIGIYVNDELVTTVDASDFRFETGRLGVNGISGKNGNQWDDFGGGEWR